MPDTCSAFRSVPLFVIPCLNEVRYIARVLDWLLRTQSRIGGLIVVADGGSTDGTREISEAYALRHQCIQLTDNPDRLQSAGINRAIQDSNDTATHLIRIDAHCDYPENFCDLLLEEAAQMGVASIVVSMTAKGYGPVQNAIAAAQNAPVGNGGSKHRLKPVGQFVDHGHHALMELSAFREVGGYDVNFSHNEDAELDYRLRAAGHKIWLTDRLEVTYFPRDSGQALALQYFNYGKGRARNLTKHRTIPKLRQIKVIAILPLVAMAALLSVSPLFAIPALAWMAYCLTMAMERIWAARDLTLIIVAPIAMIMHIAWSSGFWWSIFQAPAPREGQTA